MALKYLKFILSLLRFNLPCFLMNLCIFLKELLRLKGGCKGNWMSKQSALKFFLPCEVLFTAQSRTDPIMHLESVIRFLVKK